MGKISTYTHVGQACHRVSFEISIKANDFHFIGLKFFPFWRLASNLCSTNLPGTSKQYECQYACVHVSRLLVRSYKNKFRFPFLDRCLALLHTLSIWWHSNSWILTVGVVGTSTLACSRGTSYFLYCDDDDDDDDDYRVFASNFYNAIQNGYHYKIRFYVLYSICVLYMVGCFRDPIELIRLIITTIWTATLNSIVEISREDSPERSERWRF